MDAVEKTADLPKSVAEAVVRRSLVEKVIEPAHEAEATLGRALVHAGR